MPNQEKIKVLYIAGWGRSGTTLLDNILGQLRGFFSAGELRYIWERGFLENRKCGCGEPFSECSIWQRIAQRAFSPESQISARAMNEMTFRYTRTICILWMMASRGGDRNSTGFNKYLETVEKLYWAIAHETKNRIIVDSSKFPMYGAALRLIPSLDVHFVHLIRDPRAVAHSWAISKPASNFDVETYLPKIHPASSAIRWNGWNLAIEYLGSLQPEKYLRLNYETLVARPHSTLKRILAFLGETRAELPFKDETTVVIGKNHNVAGNPNRFIQGNVEIKPDLRWLDGMHPYHKSLVMLLTLPFLSRFGYSI